MYTATINIPQYIVNKLKLYRHDHHSRYFYKTQDLSIISGTMIYYNDKEIKLLKINNSNNYQYRAINYPFTFKEEWLKDIKKFPLKFNKIRFIKNNDFYILDKTHKLIEIEEGIVAFISLINGSIYRTFHIDNTQSHFDELMENFEITKHYSISGMKDNLIKQRIIG